MPKSVFLSYATPDREQADQVCAGLEADGIDCWIAPRDVPAGEDYAETITAAIASCPVLVLLFSATSAASEHVEREVHLAAGAKAAIVPLRLEPVNPQGAFKYLLANRQYLDAFPRLAPQMPALRAEIRRLLQARGAAAPTIASRRTPFERVLTTIGAWALLAALDTVLIVWMQRYWFNLTPLTSVPLASLRHPLPLLLLLAGPVVALGAQYWITRTPSTVASLDALFAVAQGGAPRMRLAVAVALATLVAASIPAAPSVIRVRLVDGPIDAAGADYTPARRPLSSTSYVAQTRRHYAVDVNVGRFNPPGPYILRTALAPYATNNGVEFSEFWVDRALDVSSVMLVTEHDQSDGHVDVELQGPRRGRPPVLFTVRYYRDGDASPQATVTAIIRRGTMEQQDVEPIEVPLQ